MAARPYKRGKKGAGRHVQLPEYLQATEAWASLKPGPRALYIELKRRFNGSNNGKIFLSHRDAAKLLNVHRNTVGAYFAELEGKGFLRITRGPYLGPSGVGLATCWALEELPIQNEGPATKRFMKWQAKKNPCTKNRPTRHNSCAAAAEVDQSSDRPVLKIVTG